MTRTALALAALLLGACAPRTPRVVAGPLVDGLDAFLAAHPVADGQAVRIDEVARTATASHHLVQIHGSETPHRHVAHELTAVLLRGRGTLTLDGRTYELRAGDVSVVPRGHVHWFARRGREPAITFVTFSPPLDAPDTVPEVR
jgi:quercetin dioxygenase-like cupin family protein